MIIAVGITCLVGILTAIDTILFSMSDNFNKLGANAFNIRPKYERIRGNRHGRRTKVSDNIFFDQAISFKEQFQSNGSLVSVSTRCGSNNLIAFGKKETNPSVMVDGVDENYLSVSSFELANGRNFTKKETKLGNHIAIIGQEIVDKLFLGNGASSLQKSIKINERKYKVVGVLESKGSTMNNGGDRRVFIPLSNAKRYYGTSDKNYTVTATVLNPAKMNIAISDATGVMRNIRRLKAYEDNDFSITKSDGILSRLKEMTTEIRLSSIIIALMTLLGASIGLMNIMLVSVTERTREIGIRKALGAPRKSILFQFLTEAVVICLLGGILGIILGIGIGFGVAAIINGKFIIPVNWMILGIIVCVIVGVLSGLYPALKASRLDPVESLRYE